MKTMHREGPPFQPPPGTSPAESGVMETRRRLAPPRGSVVSLRPMRFSRRRRGFTLIELLVVVAMVGVLAALAIVGYRKYLHGASSGEARAIMQGIRAGQENYRGETLVYLGCSGCGGQPCAPGGGSLATHYPRAVPDDQK